MNYPAPEGLQVVEDLQSLGNEITIPRLTCCPEPASTTATHHHNTWPQQLLRYAPASACAFFFLLQKTECRLWRCCLSAYPMLISPR